MNTSTKTLYALAVAILLIASTAQAQNIYGVRPGDILFQDLDCGDACDAIEKVSTGAKGMDFSHCGIVISTPEGYKVVEAYGRVKATPLDTFLKRSLDTKGQPKVLLGRVKDEDKAIGQKSAQLATKYVGKAYDDAFDMRDDSYYCSELVYELYREANDEKPYFKLNKMTFKEPGTDKIMPFWKKYFEDLRVAVPEGDWGINPGAISRSKKLELRAIRFK